MAISTKYGKVDIPKIGSDEPVFILRAQDRSENKWVKLKKGIFTMN